MNAITPIIVLPIQRPQYMNAHITLETFERWFICNESALRRYWRDLQKYIDANATVGEFVEWAQCQYDIAKISSEPQQPMPGSPALVEGSSPTAGPRTAGAGTSHGVHMDEQHNKLVAYVLDFPEEAANTIAELRQKRAEHERLIDQLKELLEADYPMHALDLVKAEFEEIHGPKN